MGFCMALSMNSVGIPGGFRGSAGFSGKFGVWGGFGRFGGSKGFGANSHLDLPVAPPFWWVCPELGGIARYLAILEKTIAIPKTQLDG